MHAALSIQHAMCVRHIVICGLSDSIKFFPHYLINDTIFEGRGGGGGGLQNIKCVFWFSLQLWSETFIILRNERDMIINVYWCSCNVPATLLSDFNETWVIWWIFENYTNIKFHENQSIGSREFPCGRSDTTNLIVAFRKFASARNNSVSPKLA